MRSEVARRLMMVVIGSMAVAACGHPDRSVRDEVNRLQRATCLDRPATIVSPMRATTWQVTAEWTCAMSLPWSEYVATLDHMPAYRRREQSSTRVSYSRARSSDYYHVTVTTSPERADEVRVQFTAGPS